MGFFPEKIIVLNKSNLTATTFGEKIEFQNQGMKEFLDKYSNYKWDEELQSYGSNSSNENFSQAIDLENAEKKTLLETLMSSKNESKRIVVDKHVA